jgi:hypothetical protein
MHLAVFLHVHLVKKQISPAALAHVSDTLSVDFCHEDRAEIVPKIADRFEVDLETMLVEDPRRSATKAGIVGEGSALHAG